MPRGLGKHRDRGDLIDGDSAQFGYPDLTDSAEAILRIRALRASHDFDDYWQFHKQQEFKRNHLSKFQDPKRFLFV